MESAEPLKSYRPLTDAELRDLGFGSVVSERSRRLLNPDGTFNVRRTGLPFWSSVSLYHAFLTMRWGYFFGIFVAIYFICNIVFGAAFWLCGPAGLQGEEAMKYGGEFWRAFFFSVQTAATIGYGQIHAVGVVPNLIVTVEALVSVIIFAFGTGLVFARFARPGIGVRFSRNALIAPYRGITSFQFRIANARNNEIIELNATVLLTQFENVDGRRVRKYYVLPLERKRVVFFPLSWTIVHPIDSESPLNGLTKQHLEERKAEFLILLSGVDQIFSQTVHTRSSYAPNDLVWNARFKNIFKEEDDGSLEIAVDHIDDFEPAQ